MDTIVPRATAAVAPTLDDCGPVVALSRLRFKSAVTMIQAYFRFRALRESATRAPGFVRGSLIIAGPTTLMNTSVWSTRWAMLRWSGGRNHVRAVQWTYGRTVEVWSTYWLLLHASPSAERWDGPVRLEPASENRNRTGHPDVPVS